MKPLTIEKTTSPAGEIVLGDCGGALCVCAWAEEAEAVARKVARLIGAPLEFGSTALTRQAVGELDEYFRRERREFTVPLRLCGTDFQCAAWSAMQQIPYGATASYADEARLMGHPSAFRAVGNANGANPLVIFVPCHRIVAADGSIGGYSAGLDKKRFLLGIERVEALFP